METKNENLKDSILKKITEEKIEPKSRLYFTLKNISLWALAALSVVAGGIATSSVILRVASRARVLPPIPRESAHVLKEAFTIVPLFWLVIFGVFAYLAYKEIRNTKRGYKYTYPLIIVSTLLASTVLGIIFFAIGTASFVDKRIPEKMPFVDKIEQLEKRAWLDPENGLLAGEVSEVSEGTVSIVDRNGQDWKVDTSLVPRFVSTKLEIGSNLGIIGYIDGETFVACKIRIHESDRIVREANIQNTDLSTKKDAAENIETKFEEMRDGVCNLMDKK